MTDELGQKLRRTLNTESPPAPDGSVRVVTASGAVIGLNPTAAALWALCDGQTTVAEIVAAATELFSAEPTAIQADIVATLNQLQAQGLIA